MKVLLINGSPNQFGCTYTALHEIEKVLQEEGIEAEILWLENKPVYSCLDCGGCEKTSRCICKDICNTVIEKAIASDGLILGSPVHYGSASGMITAVMDRVFYAASSQLRYKPAAAIVSCRRAGSTATLEQLNKYFMINQMPVVSSQYWNMVHGNTPEEVQKDLEGLQIMRTLGHNMAWMLKAIKEAENNNIELKIETNRQRTNFIR